MIRAYSHSSEHSGGSWSGEFGRTLEAAIAKAATEPRVFSSRAGLGLFATRAFTAALQIHEVGRLEYSMRLGNGVSVDAAPLTDAVARYINDNARSGAVTVRYVKDPAGLRALVVAKRAIVLVKELNVAYGAGYWRLLGALGIERQAAEAIDVADAAEVTMHA